VGGFINIPAFHTFGTWLEHTIHFEPAESVALESGEGAGALGTGLLRGINLPVAGGALLLALVGVGLGWLVYRYVYERQRATLPPARRPDDPLRGYLGPIFTVLENKYWVDELYWLVILNPYIALSRFLADVVDWRFWHDWFHDAVIYRGFRVMARWLADPIDLGIIDGFANGLANIVQRSAGSLRRIQTGFVRNYALAVFLGVVLIVGYLLFW
jgi:NADH-quinone oxidoreductase subunit L